MGQPPGAVLFACNLNIVRSAMAEALMKLAFGKQVFVDSCGVAPSRTPDPFAIEVMDEVGWDISGHRPKAFADLEDDSFDLIVTLSPEAHHNALDWAFGKAVDVVYWPTADPTGAAEGREQILEAYRQTRDHLRGLIQARFGETLSLGG